MSLTEGLADVCTSIDTIDTIAISMRAALPDATSDPTTLKHLEGITTSTQALRAFLGAGSAALEFTSEERHRIRNLLNHIAGPVQLLQRRLNEQQYAHALQEMRDLVDACSETIDSFGRVANNVVRALESQSVVAGRAEPARILVAEDDRENRLLLVEALRGEGHAVDVAVDGVEALALAQREDFDLLLLDLGLPQMSGFDVLERLQADGWQTPVVVVTGRRGVEDAVRCIEHGADDFLTKPIQFEILRARVKSCVEKMRLREREYAQFFPPKLARMFARRPKLIDDLPSKHAEVSVLFCDMRNFTAVSERLGPERTTRWLRGVMNELSELVILNEGVLVDFAGDEIMAMWGAPEEIPDHAVRACDTAVQILERLPAMSEVWRDEIGGETDLAIGVNSGRAMVGHVGTARKTKYGALGDVVNIGSRVLGATKYLQTRLLITGATRAAFRADWGRGELRRLCKVRVQNLMQPVELYEVRPPANAESTQELTARYETALAKFEQAEFNQASAILGQLLVDYPNDGPSLMLMSRVVEAMLSHDATFDPVWTLTGK